MTVRRPLITATAAGSLLFALWFVPSANATVDDHSPASPPRTEAVSTQQQAHEVQDLSLADTGSVDTTPYLLGGTAFLGLGAAMVTVSM
ncbi:hypothetical protein, partial [Streptomyces sp. H27-D2]|uniref:hypothetical protein n=1 Tax=Streptomyces sp. H27-D2 TaxID=3046304 RepID=UPI002DB5D3BB